MAYLSERDVALTELPRRESFAITKHWTSVFAQTSSGVSLKLGSKAVSEWLGTDDEDLILLFLSSRITAFPISTNSRPCLAFKYSGHKIDLSEYHQLEFAVFPESYDWTLVHTHEDFAFGGPYFVRAEDLHATPS